MQAWHNILFLTGTAFVVGYKISIQKHETIITVKNKMTTNVLPGTGMICCPAARIIMDTNGNVFFNTPIFPLKSNKKAKFIDAQLQIGKTYKIETRGNKWGRMCPNIYKVTEITK